MRPGGYRARAPLAEREGYFAGALTQVPWLEQSRPMLIVTRVPSRLNQRKETSIAGLLSSEESVLIKKEA